MRKGRTPQPPYLKLLRGNPGKRPIKADPASLKAASFDPIAPPVPLSERQQELWRTFIHAAPWLSPHDAPAAFVWVALMAEFERDPGAMVASRIAQLRGLSTDLGLAGPGSRVRFVTDTPKADPSARYFD